MSDRLMRAHMTASYDRGEKIADAVARLLGEFGYTDEFVEEAVETVLAGQFEQAGATWAYLVEAAEIADPLGRSIDVDVPFEKMVGSSTHDGTPLEVVYRKRSAVLFADLIGSGVGRTSAAESVIGEIRLTASSDVATAGRKAEQTYGLTDRRVTGWKRVPNATACRWCRYIATQLYSREDLAPAHRGCGCGTRAVYGDVPGNIVDREALAEIKADGVPKNYRKRDRLAREANEAISE